MVSPTPMRFAGEYQDTGSGLYNLRARSYDTATGRFASLDPLAHGIENGATSSYIYTGDNPTSFVDPSGMGQVHPNTCGSIWCYGQQAASGCSQSVQCLALVGMSLIDPLLAPEAEGLALSDAALADELAAEDAGPLLRHYTDDEGATGIQKKGERSSRVGTAILT